MQLKRHFTEVLTDQIPPLKELHRAVEEILLLVRDDVCSLISCVLLHNQRWSRRVLRARCHTKCIQDAPPPTTSSLVIIEQVPEMREKIASKVDFAEVAKAQLAQQFSNDKAQRTQDMMR